MESTEAAFALFLGARIEEILRVVVHVEEDEFVLPDTVVFVLDRGIVQLLSDPASKRVERIETVDDAIIEGDYEDRTRVSFRQIALAELPLEISSVYLIHETIGDETKRYLVGAFLYGESMERVLGINMHLDDIEVGNAESLWHYVGRILFHASRVTAERVATQSAVK